jgi:hypothetical protein
MPMALSFGIKNLKVLYKFAIKKGKAIPVTSCGGPWGCGMLRFPHSLDNQLTDGSEVVGFMHWPPFTPRKIPGTHFCYRLSQPQGHIVAGRIRSIKKSNDLIWNQTHDLLACRRE